MNKKEQDYDTYINSIIKERGQGSIPADLYYERHHIIPVCLGGLPPPNEVKLKANTRHPNIIGLFPQEHYTAHRLLTYKYPGNVKIMHAYSLMSESGNYFISAEEYANMKNARHLSSLQNTVYQVGDKTLNKIFANANEAAEFYECDKQTIIDHCISGEIFMGSFLQFVD